MPCSLGTKATVTSPPPPSPPAEPSPLGSSLLRCVQPVTARAAVAVMAAIIASWREIFIGGLLRVVVPAVGSPGGSATRCLVVRWVEPGAGDRHPDGGPLADELIAGIAVGDELGELARLGERVQTEAGD